MLSLLLAKKLFFPFSKTRSWNSLTILVCLTLAFAIAALSLTGALLDAFHNETKTTFQNIQGDLFVMLPQNANVTEITTALKKTAPGLIGSFAFSSEAPVIVANPDKQKFGSTQLSTRLLSKHNTPYNLPETCAREDFVPLLDNQVIIGATLADELGLYQGDTILLCTAELFSDPDSIDWDEVTVQVEKIIASNIEEIDSGLLLSNQSTFEKITRIAQPNRLDIKLKSPKNIGDAITKLEKKIGYRVHAWLDLYPTLQAALRLETMIFWIVLIIVIAIILLSLPSLLVLLIEYKRSTISILLVTGVPLTSLRQALHFFGFLLIGVAQLIGLCSAVIITMISNKLKLLPLPSNYYHTHIYLTVSPVTSLIIIITSTILGGLVVWCTARTLSHTKIRYFLKKGL